MSSDLVIILTICTCSSNEEVELIRGTTEVADEERATSSDLVTICTCSTTTEVEEEVVLGSGETLVVVT